jgi:3-hydroxyisobutyrate dehydrogenase
MALVDGLMSEQRIGWIGTGVMGLSMCGHLMGKGHAATIYSRTRARAQPLLDKGATWADTPAAVAAQSDVIFTIVGLPSDVREVYLDKNGVLEGAKPGAILVDMTTTEPSLSRAVYDAAKAKGIATIDAPVSGGDVGARNATLSIMVGGDKDAVERVMPLFQAMGKNIVYQGGPGSGQHTKMCNQIVLAGTIIGVCESLLYGYKAGLDLETMLGSITKGAAQCWILDNLAPKMVKRDFDPGFFVEHFEKDLGIALDECKRSGLAMPGLALVRQFYVALKAQGHGRLGYHALLLVLEQLSAVDSSRRA